MKSKLNLVAFDCGNSSIRTMLCCFDGEKVVSEVVLQEPNHSIQEGDYFYWDMPAIFETMKKGLALAAKRVDRIHSVGICTWGVDFLMLNKNDEFIGKALCYRNTIGAEQMARQSAEEQREMFYRTGILADKINSIYMLKGIKEHFPEIIKTGKKLLMVPDVFVYMFTGKKINEPSELSTSHMLDVRTMKVDEKQCEYAGVELDIFSEIGEHGKCIGNIRQEILNDLGIMYDIPFICVPSHDTACAVMAIPSREENYLFVSSGTWALIGAQCERPIINEQVLNANLTNEVGAFGRTTLLRNSAGMFITQRLKEEYEIENGKVSWSYFTSLAEKWKGSIQAFDVNDERLFNPKSMVKEIQAMIHPEENNYIWEEILASTYIALGDSYVKVLETLKNLTGEDYKQIYIVGGGSKNAMINQRCADMIQMPVATCDMECSSVGNAVAQLAYHYSEYSYERLREIIVNSLEVKVYVPN